MPTDLPQSTHYTKKEIFTVARIAGTFIAGIIGTGLLIAAAVTAFAQPVDDKPLTPELEMQYISAASGTGALVHCMINHDLPQAAVEPLYESLRATFNPHSGQDTPMGNLGRFTYMVMQVSIRHGVWLTPPTGKEGEETVEVGEHHRMVQHQITDASVCPALHAWLEHTFMGTGKLFPAAAPQGTSIRG